MRGHDLEDQSLAPLHDKGHHRSRAESWTSDNPNQAMSCVMVWYLFSAASTFINKILIKQYQVSAELLTVFHLAVGTSCDAIFLCTPKTSKFKVWHFHPIQKKGLIKVIPLSMMAVTAKILTYWSYKRVPVSITHTAKASSPLFNVFLAWMIYGKRHSTVIYLSLLPIVAGVSLASISEFSINDLAIEGVLCSIGSSMIGVVQNMYSKYLLRHRIVGDSINLHFYNGLMSVILNLPMLALQFVVYGSSGSAFPLQFVIIGSLLQFFSSLTSYYTLGKTTELTYSVLGTLKRVVIIFSAVVYFGTPVTPLSFLGMLLAIGGIFCYQWGKTRDRNTGI